MLVDRVEQRGRLDPVPRAALPGVHHAARVDRCLHRGHDEARPGRRGLSVPVRDDLVEVVARVDVHDGEREERGGERLDREVQQHRGVLAAAEEQDGSLALRGDLSDDEDGVRLEKVEVVDPRRALRVVRRCRGVGRHEGVRCTTSAKWALIVVPAAITIVTGPLCPEVHHW